MEINGKRYRVTADIVTGAEIKRLAGAPSGWVVNRLVRGNAPDPEVADDERVPSIGRYRVRNPSVGASGGPTEHDPDRPYCKPDQSCRDFTCGN